MAIVEVSVVPIGTGSTGVSEYVAACHEVLKQEKRIRYQLTPMATVLEGDLDVLLEVVRKLHEVPYQKGAERVYTAIRIDDRRDKESTMEGKVKSVEDKL